MKKLSTVEYSMSKWAFGCRLSARCSTLCLLPSACFSAAKPDPAPDLPFVLVPTIQRVFFQPMGAGLQALGLLYVGSVLVLTPVCANRIVRERLEQWKGEATMNGISLKAVAFFAVFLCLASDGFGRPRGRRVRTVEYVEQTTEQPEEQALQQPEEQPKEQPDRAGLLKRLHVLANRARVEHGCPEWKTDPELTRIAQQTADNMADGYGLTHAAGGAEIIAQYDTPEGAMDGWLGSYYHRRGGGHRWSILSTHTRVGWGAAQSADGTWYWAGHMEGGGDYPPSEDLAAR